MVDNELGTPGKRLEWFITENYGTIPKFIETFGLNRSHVYRMIGDRTDPRLSSTGPFASAGLNVHWWITGEGAWWAPNGIGRELARRKGIVVPAEAETEVTVDYRAMLKALFEYAAKEISGPARIEELQRILAPYLAGVANKARCSR